MSQSPARERLLGRRAPIREKLIMAPKQDSALPQKRLERGVDGGGLLSGVSLALLLGFISQAAFAEEAPVFEQRPQTIFAAKCFDCHGKDRVKRKAELELTSAAAALRGGESGPAVVAGKLDESLLWEMVSSRAMPPEGAEPLTDDEVQAIKNWILAGAKSNQTDEASDGLTDKERDFWSFRRLVRPEARVSQAGQRVASDAAKLIAQHSPIDQFVCARLRESGLSFAPEADRRTLIRRVYFDLMGLPPSPAEVEQFINHPADDAYENLVDRLLASPHYGERWGRQWLDIVGYADSNGYIRHDSPRPLAYRYRDYVIQSLNEDKPYDQFWTEQLAGDELVNYPEAQQLSQEDLAKLIATHYLRNAPDGTDNTEGNEITRVMERYAVLEAQLQITMSAMFGMTIECARCHSHKFDPIPQQDYYALQAIFYPAFNVKDWVQPKDRTIFSAAQPQIAEFAARNEVLDGEVASLHREFEKWVATIRPHETTIFSDNFSEGLLTSNWSNTAPGDDTPAGNPAVAIGGQETPAAFADEGRLYVLPAAPPDTVWLVTRRSFDWTPERLGDWIQVTFDLFDTRGADGNPAERVGYYIALHDFDDNKDTPFGDNHPDSPKGNILLDGDSAGGAEVTLDYPGRDQVIRGRIGTKAYLAGANLGVRVTRVDDDKFMLQQLVDGQPEERAVFVSAGELPDGGFGFELCCGRSFVVDNLTIKGSPSEEVDPLAEEVSGKQTQLKEALAAAEARRPPEPERIAWVTDLSDLSPTVPLLKRGDYFKHGPSVEPGPLSVLVDDDNLMLVEPPASGAKTTGRRLAFARWATRPGSRAAALLARVQADRIWSGHFGEGLVPTPENFGASGVPPTHPELLEWLAAELVDQGWRLKPIHRQIVLSRTYRQTGEASALAIAKDSQNRLYSRFPVHRLEAEQIHDSMLMAGGVLNLKPGGPSVEFVDAGTRQIVLPGPTGDGLHEVDRRSIYIRYRRSQPLSFLQVFDQALPEPNCIMRSTSTVVGQSLALLNGAFAVRMGQEFAARLIREAGPGEKERIRQAFLVALSRAPTETELKDCAEFLGSQASLRSQADPAGAEQAALADLCRMLMACNEFLYLQ